MYISQIQVNVLFKVSKQKTDACFLSPVPKTHVPECAKECSKACQLIPLFPPKKVFILKKWWVISLNNLYL